MLGDPIPVDARFCLILRGSAKLGLGDFEAALADLSIVEEAMSRQRVILDWYWRMPLHSRLTDLWLQKGDLERAQSHAREFLQASLATRERTFQARAWETNARVLMAMGQGSAAEECIGKALEIVEHFEAPIAAWRVYATAAEVENRDSELARTYWSRSADTIRRLADSLPLTEPVREIFLSAAQIRRILDSANRGLRAGAPHDIARSSSQPDALVFMNVSR
jgi:tetratricopeptide (TPR) repeat protein